MLGFTLIYVVISMCVFNFLIFSCALMLLSTVLSFQPKEFPSALLVGPSYKSDEFRQLELI